MPLRLAVISDIHSNLEAFKAVVADLPAYDQLLCLGDLVGYGPRPDEVIDELRRLTPKAILMGNHDYAVATGDTTGFSIHAAKAVDWTRRHMKQQNQHFLSTLLPSLKLDFDGICTALFHGSPRDPLVEYVFPGISESLARKMIQGTKGKVVLLGHTHVPMLYSFEEELLGNPGSVGQPRDGDPRASYAILTISDEKLSFDIRRVRYDIDSVANKIISAGLPNFLAERLFAGI